MPPSVGGVSGGMHARNLRIGSIPPGCIKHRRCHTANSVKKLPIPIFRPAIIGQRSCRHPLSAANVAGVGFTPDLLSPVILGMEWLFALLELLVSRLCSQAGIIYPLRNFDFPVQETLPRSSFFATRTSMARETRGRAFPPHSDPLAYVCDSACWRYAAGSCPATFALRRVFARRGGREDAPESMP